MKPIKLRLDIQFISLVILTSILFFSSQAWADTEIRAKFKLKNEEQVLTKIEGACKELLKKTEWVAIVTWDESQPHLVGTWGDYVSVKDGNIILIPAGYYFKTEENLKKNKNIQLMIASKQVQGTHGLGQGCVVFGEGKIQTEGKYAQYMKEKHPWARGALVVTVKEIELHL